MVTRRDVVTLVESGVSYDDVGRRLGIHPGLAYMIATGLPADGGDALTPGERARPGYLATSTQHLANPQPAHNPTHHGEVEHWMRARVQRDAQMREAGSRDWPQPPPLGQTGDDADVCEVLARDHNAIHKLANRLKYTPTAAKGATEDQIAVRAAAVDAIRDGVQRHEAAEEQYLWPFVRTALANGDEVADAARQQEQHGREVLDALARATPGSDEFDDLVEQLQHALRSHVAYEDRVLLTLAEATRHEERAGIGEEIAAAERSSDDGSA